ncbi:unnamed protein product [Aureobasidium mustum]|uniref:Uncharacterized protein n=1 Tax=Aureobasidium mustum TaxID=2773714 RepID=A0A9N8KAQ5_9PEZI|nr:unnamed protein product [Aureobasidium mustum]
MKPRATSNFDLGLSLTFSVAVFASKCFRLLAHAYLSRLLRQDPRSIVVYISNRSTFTLASQTHFGRRARAWQRRATPTLHNISERRLPLGTPADRLLLRSSKPRTPFNHINVVKAEDLDRTKAHQEPGSKIFVSSSSVPSPRSSRELLDSDGSDKMHDHDSGADDQMRLAELATARLERQSKRIIENDPTIPMNKLILPRTARNKVSKHWPDAEYPDSSDGDVTSKSLVSRKGSPFDVHAKVFRPGSRESSVSRSLEAPRRDSATLSGDDGDFQLVTSKRTKASSKFAVGLNAREVKTDDKSSAIAVSFNRQEINEVFGNDLPPLTYFQGNVGNKDGQIGFAMHPNGDTSAQQWSQSDYQWFNIGQFSNSRRRTEGTLASHRLRGENELHSLLQHSLCYFRAVAKQHEASSMKLPFGPKELQAYMPKVSINRPARKVAVTPVIQTPISSESAQRLPEKEQHTRTPSFGPELEPWAQGYASCVRSRRKLSGTPVVPASRGLSFQPDSLQSTKDVSTMPNSALNQWPHSLTTLNNMSFGALPTNRNHDASENSYRTPGLAGSITTRTDVNEGSLYLNSFLPKSVPQTATSQLHSSILNLSTLLEKTQPQSDSSGQTPASTQRSFTKACLDKIFDAASTRNMNNSTGARTVLHDPFHSQSSKTSPVIKQDSGVKHYNPIWSSTPVGEGASGCIGQASSSTSNDDLVFDPHVSEPEFVPESKTMEIVDISLPHMTTGELAIYSRPSPQNFKGPFFMGSPDVPSEASRKSHEQELYDWFYSGLTTIERQDEHFEFIKTAHNQALGVTQSKVNPGPIGTPSTRSMSSKNPEAEPFNDVTTRLFLSMHESLSQYTQGPLEQRRGYLAPFCDPPEWCIDKSANGNNSFFGEDWSQPPERISRDSRYRPLPFEGRFGAYDGHRGIDAGSIRPSVGRLRFGSSLKY